MSMSKVKFLGIGKGTSDPSIAAMWDRCLAAAAGRPAATALKAGRQAAPGFHGIGRGTSSGDVWHSALAAASGAPGH